MGNLPFRILVAVGFCGLLSLTSTGEAAPRSVQTPQPSASPWNPRPVRLRSTPATKTGVRPLVRRVPPRRLPVRKSPVLPKPRVAAPRLLPLVPQLTPVPVLSFTPQVSASAPVDVALYTREGRLATLDDLVAATRMADVVFLGEYHDDPGAHALEKSLLVALMPLANQPPVRPVALSLEMFDVDVQLVLNEYTQGLVRERDFLAASRPWGNYANDYRPLVEFARARRVPVVATNAPHRYVMRVGRYGAAGLAPLTPEAKGWVPPSPWPEASVEYADRFGAFAREALGLGASGGHGASVSARYMFEAQWLRDITMARSIAAHLEKAPGALVLHVNGLFHSQSGQGTVEALRHYRPGVRPLTVAVVRGEGSTDFVRARMADLGDFVAVSSSVAPRTETR